MADPRRPHPRHSSMFIDISRPHSAFRSPPFLNKLVSNRISVLHVAVDFCNVLFLARVWYGSTNVSRSELFECVISRQRLTEIGCRQLFEYFIFPFQILLTFIAFAICIFFFLWICISSYPPRKLFAIPCGLYSKIAIFDFFHVQGLHIFASTLSNFVDRSVRFGQLIGRSLADDFHGNLISRHSILYCYEEHSLVLNSRHRAELWTFQTWLKWTSFVIREFKKTELWIFRFLW
jgi:hypothetical protein